MSRRIFLLVASLDSTSFRMAMVEMLSDLNTASPFLKKRQQILGLHLTVPVQKQAQSISSVWLTCKCNQAVYQGMWTQIEKMLCPLQEGVQEPLADWSLPMHAFLPSWIALIASMCSWVWGKNDSKKQSIIKILIFISF